MLSQQNTHPTPCITRYLHSHSKTKALGQGYVMLDTVQMQRGFGASFAQLKIYCLNPKLVPLKLAPSWGPGIKA